MFQQRRAVVGVLMLALVFANLVRPTAAALLLRYFPETGHTVSDEFWQFWQATPNALAVLGYPLSAPFTQESSTEPGTFLRVQYFERAILEEYPTPGRRNHGLGSFVGQWAYHTAPA